MAIDDSERSFVPLLGAVARASEHQLLDRFARAGYPELRHRHAKLFQALADGDLRAIDLAAHLKMTPQAVAQLVDDLENSGNVARTPDPADGRARRVTLTERGRHALQVCEAILDEMAQEAADIVGAGRLGDTRRVLEELARHFDRAG